MKEEIEKIVIKAKRNDKEALYARILLSKIYTYGMYGEEKNSKQAEFWSNKVKELEQRLSKDSNISNNENIKKNKPFTNRFDNIQNNLKFDGTTDTVDDKYTNRKQRFDNIQNNLKFISTEDKK